MWGFPKQIRGTFFGGPHNKDYSILGSILGFPYLGNYHMCSCVYYIFCRIRNNPYARRRFPCYFPFRAFILPSWGYQNLPTSLNPHGMNPESHYSPYIHMVVDQIPVLKLDVMSHNFASIVPYRLTNVVPKDL